MLIDRPPALLLLLLAATAGAALPRAAAAQASAAEEGAVNVFLDCGFRCDQDYLRTEITYVNWVRDRAVADVHLLVTTQGTGGGGTEFTLAFLGQKAYGGVGDTLRLVAPATNSGDDTRRALGRTIAFGLVPYVARTPLAARMTVAVARTSASAAAQTSPQRDPWNYWTFRISGNTNFNGERLYESRNYYTTLSANRTTSAWKTSFNLNQNQSSSRFVFENETTGAREAFTNFRRSANLSNLTVKSLTAHWSAGLRTGVSSSTYVNQRMAVRVVPAIEYNVFPYAQSTRRQLRFQYGVGAQRFDYKDTTIYGKTEETKPLQSGSMALDFRQPWGSASFSVDGQQYFDDLERYRWSFFTNASVRVFRGFNVNVYGGYERLRDQIYLAARGASRDEILTRQRQLETGYSYWGGVGLSYTFGSIYNNVVNPRFGGSGGTIIIE